AKKILDDIVLIEKYEDPAKAKDPAKDKDPGKDNATSKETKKETKPVLQKSDKIEVTTAWWDKVRGTHPGEVLKAALQQLEQWRVKLQNRWCQDNFDGQRKALGLVEKAAKHEQSSLAHKADKTVLVNFIYNVSERLEDLDKEEEEYKGLVAKAEGEVEHDV